MAPQQSDPTAEPSEPDDTAVTDAAGEHVEARAAERSAERAAALAVTEGFHPLRVRPYVNEPDDTLGGAGTTVRPLIDAATPDSGPATQDLGLFPAAYAATGQAQEYPADGRPDEAAAAARGRHRRRRRGIVVAAAAVAASALAAGAVAVTGSVTGEEKAGDRAQPEPPSAMPEVTLPANAGHGAATQPRQVTPHWPMRATTTPAPRVTPSSSASSAPSTTTPSPTPPPASASPTATAPPTTTAPPPGTAPTQADVLQLGSSGPEVVDLQWRLSQVRCYRGPMDGYYDWDVERAVAAFQDRHDIREDPSGVYGPATRDALLRATRDGSHRHR